MQSKDQMNEYVISGRFDEYYQTEKIDSMTESDSFNLQASKIEDIYQLYDDLMDGNQSMSKKLLGYGEDADGQELESYPIYEYIIQAPQTSQKTHGLAGVTDLYPAAKILITTGVHGNEKAAVYGVYEFVKQLLLNPQNSQALNDLKSNFDFRVIPIVNPGGYNYSFRNTLTEVDLNRNFSDGWGELDHLAKGKKPYSEGETKILRNWLNEHGDAFAYLDYHNFTRRGDSIGMPERKTEMTSYHVSPNKELNKLYSSLIRRLSLSWQNNYLENFSELGNLAFGFLYNNDKERIPSTIAEAYYKVGIRLTAIPEITYNDPVDPSIHNSQTVLELSAEFFINYLLTLVDRFKDDSR